MRISARPVSPKSCPLRSRRAAMRKCIWPARDDCASFRGLHYPVESPMRLSAPFPVLFFASAAHCLHHVLLALYLTLVLVIGQAWHLPYNDMIALWTLGAMLVGLGAPFAGWLGDRVGETKMLVLCFLGLGTSGILCGLAQN